MKLTQYKNTKSKRLDELESKAREFEVLSSVSLNKIIGLLSSKEKKINDLKATESNLSGILQHSVKISNDEIQRMIQKINEESKLKLEAISKLQNYKNFVTEGKLTRNNSQQNERIGQESLYQMSTDRTKISFNTSSRQFMKPDINSKMLENVRQQVTVSRNNASGLRSLVIAGQNKTHTSLGRAAQNIIDNDSLCSTISKKIPKKTQNDFSTLNKHSLIKY